MIDFKGAHYPKSVILYAVYFYVRFAVSYRDLEEIMAERGVDVDHAFKSSNSAAATLAGIEVAHMIRKGQFDRPGKSGFEQFAEFAG